MSHIATRNCKKLSHFNRHVPIGAYLMSPTVCNTHMDQTGIALNTKEQLHSIEHMPNVAYLMIPTTILLQQ